MQTGLMFLHCPFQFEEVLEEQLIYEIRCPVILQVNGEAY